MVVGFQPRRRLVAVVAFDGVVLGDLATPCEVFGRVLDGAGHPLYEVRICSTAPIVESTHVALAAPWRLSCVSRADTVIVPGIDRLDRAPPRSSRCWSGSHRICAKI